MQPPTSTHIRTNAVKTSNTALQVQEPPPAARNLDELTERPAAKMVRKYDHRKRSEADRKPEVYI